MLVSVANALNGSVSLDENGNISFIPDADFSGEATFEYTVSDGNGGLTTQVVTLNVKPVADAPTLAAPDALGNEDTAIALNIASSLTDVDGSESLSIEISGVPEGAVLSAGTDNGDGTWTLNAPQLAGLTITPPANSDADFTLTVTATSTEAANGDGNDTIADFQAGAGSDDMLDLSGVTSVNSLADVQANATQVGSHTLIDLGGGDTVQLNGVNLFDLHDDDFLF